jgi:hypothetical protein
MDFFILKFFLGVLALSVGCVFGGYLIIVFDFLCYLMCLTCDDSPGFRDLNSAEVADND